MAVNDIYTDGIAGGWKVRDASGFTEATTLEADIAIIGTGAGGGTAAEILAAAGFKVLMIEEGPLKTSASFKAMDEAKAYAELYQEGGARLSKDGAVSVMQGRAVGGTTTVNWTSSFRTPAETLKHWASAHKVVGGSPEEMAPWFAKMEERLGIAPWGQAANANNAVLQRACQKLGWEWHVIPRNVRGCWNSGYCGFGCPANAKQSMLVSTIPAALGHGAQLVHHLRVDRMVATDNRISSLECVALDPEHCRTLTGIAVQVKAKHFILAAGAINGPALLLRSKLPDPYQRVGKRTMIHPVALSLAEMPEPVEAFYGAPQSVASDHFQWQGDFNQAPGFKLEVAPMPPGLSSAIMLRHGKDLVENVAKLPKLNAMLALGRDGFHAQSEGGQVSLGDNGEAVLDYPFTPYNYAGFKKAFLTMAEAQFAAGAKQIMPGHLDGKWCSSLAEAKQHIEALAYKPLRLNIFTAHLMGGCAMGEDPTQAVVKSDGSHHHVANLSVFDGSVFPTSIGANPQLSIYGLVCRNATQLATRLKA